MIKKNSKLSPAGITIVTSMSTGNSIQTDTLMCGHCGAHWEMRPGSGNVRGYCCKCSSPVCGPKCAGKCVPLEAQIDNLSEGKAADADRPMTVGYTGAPKIWTPF